MQHPDARLLIFARAPVPGRVKTRLIPALGAEAAARLQARLTEALVAAMAVAGPCPLELWVDGDPAHPHFLRLADRFGVSLHPQRGADLGERMARAFGDALARGTPVVLIGSDCPGLMPERIARALESLAERDVVLGPAEDGGYVLLGLRRGEPRVMERLFADMPWGTDRVLDLTRGRLAALGQTWAELPALWDLDRPEDLRRLGVEFPGLMGGLGRPPGGPGGPMD